MVVSVGLSAYQLSVYPEESGEVGAWINFSRTASGFVVACFQVRWVARVGPGVRSSTQAAVCAGFLPFIVVLHIWEKRLRKLEDRRWAVGMKLWYRTEHSQATRATGYAQDTTNQSNLPFIQTNELVGSTFSPSGEVAPGQVAPWQA